MSKVDITRNCNFKMYFPEPLGVLSFYGQVTKVPGLSLGIIEKNWLGLVTKDIGDSVTFEPLTLTLILDEDMEVLKTIINNMVETRNPYTNAREPIKTEFQSTLEINTNKNNPLLAVTFSDCWIQAIDDIEFSTTNDDDIISVTITVIYKSYEIKSIKGK